MDTRLGALVDWVRASDPHAAYRLELLDRAQRVLAGEEPAPAELRRDLAERIERWRYQHLAEQSGRLGREGRRLAEVLDLAANDLAGRAERPPRWAREAVGGTDADQAPMDDTPVDEAAACLDPAVPLAEVASRAAVTTRQCFAVPGASRHRMLLYAPLYLSSHCINYCVYCGFRYPNDTPRRHLDQEDALRQAEILRGRGFRHLLLVGGDFPRLTSVRYYAEIIAALVRRGLSAAVEIAPQASCGYEALATAGACGVTLYQETYDERLYALYHPRGTKTAYDWRLEGLERAAEAGIRRLGLGILLGLADPREDLLAMVRHAGYLQSRFPDCTLGFSLPRIYEAPDGFQTPYMVDDETFVRLYCALRMAFPCAELVLSTREPAPLRNRLSAICITQMSAGSSTTPGGYEEGAESACGQQFPVSDRRTPAEVAAWLESSGFPLLWELQDAVAVEGHLESRSP